MGRVFVRPRESSLTSQYPNDEKKIKAPRFAQKIRSSIDREAGISVRFCIVAGGCSERRLHPHGNKWTMIGMQQV
jgi:hypothetical protein